MYQYLKNSLSVLIPVLTLI